MQVQVLVKVLVLVRVLVRVEVLELWQRGGARMRQRGLQ